MFNFLKSLFQEPKFAPGARVNLLNGSTFVLGEEIYGVDGRVKTQNDHGVLVEWPRSGTRWVDPYSLCQQV